MKANTFFMKELKSFIKTNPLSSYEPNFLYKKFSNYYTSNDISHYINDNQRLFAIGLQPGCTDYNEINEDVRELVEDYLNDVFYDVSCAIKDEQIENYNNGIFDEYDDDDFKEEWKTMSDEEKLEYAQEGVELVSINEVFGLLLDDFSEIFFKKYSSYLRKQLKQGLKNNVLVDSDEYEDDYTFKYKQIPVKQRLLQTRLTQKELISIIDDEYTIDDIIEDYIIEEDFTEEYVSNVLSLLIDNNN